MDFLPVTVLMSFYSAFLTSGTADTIPGLPRHWRQQLDSHKGNVDEILQYLTEGAGRHRAYKRLARLTDQHGSRLIGSQGLEDAIDYVLQELQNDGFENVHSESVQVPHWVRGEERATLLTPRAKTMDILGLGTSVGTPLAGITAEVLVVKSFKELYDEAEKVEGKIVVFNQPWVIYPLTKEVRVSGASQAARLGARAVLIRSATPLSVYSPHTGYQEYADDVTKIPAACLTVEDAELLQRMQDTGERITIKLEMDDRNEEPTTSRNVVAEIRGSKHPDQYVIFGGHIDSWDVGTGAMDDGSGVSVSWQVLSTIKALGLTPRRTLRLVLWTDEEISISGGHEYFQQHKNEDVVMVMETDSGIFKPLGIGFKGSGLSRAILEELLQFLAPIGTTQVLPFPIGTSDIQDWTVAGVPTVGLSVADDKYFIFHHSKGDSLSVLDPDEMDLCAVVWTTVAYVVADLKDPLPRDGDHPPTLPPSTSSRPQENVCTSRAHPVTYSLSLLTSMLILFILRNMP